MATPTPSKRLQLIRRSLDLQKPRKEDAAKFWRAYCGDYTLKGRRNLDDVKDEVFLNFVFSYVESGMASLMSGEPRVSVESRNPMSDPSAPHMEATINYWFRELAAKKHFQKCLFDSHFGPAAIDACWDYDEIVDGIPQLDPMTGQMVEPEPRILKDQPKLRWLNFWNVILDPDSESLEFDRTRTERMLITKMQFEMMDGISEEVKARIKPKQLPRDISRLPFEYESKIGTDQEWVILYKTYDLENEEVTLLYEGEDLKDYLYVKPWPYEFEVGGDRFPITILDGRPSMESNYGFSDFRASWSQIQERNRVRTTLQSWARRIHPAWLAKKGMNDESDLEKFANAKIGEVIQMKNPEGIIPKPHGPIPIDLYKYDDISRDDLQNTMAFWDSQNESIANTATEASLMASKGNQRGGRKREAFEDFVAIVGAKIGGLCQQFMDKSIAVKIRQPQSPQELAWLDVNKEMIQGEFNYLVKPGVMQQHNEGLRRQQVLKYAELMANNPYVKQDALAKQITKVFEFDENEILRSDQEVQAEKAQQLPEKPAIQIDKIKPELLNPAAQNAIVEAAFKQNGVTPPGPAAPQNDMPPMDGLGSGGAPPPGMGPTAGDNQAPPPMPGGEMPPASPIQPGSEMQGGPQ